MSERKSIAPINMKTDSQVCSVTRDNYSLDDFTILAESGEISITEQKVGESCKQVITIPKNVFNKLLKWYMRPQKIIRDPNNYYYRGEK